MKSTLQKLWKSMNFPGRCPQPEPDAVLRRVNAALGNNRFCRRLPRPVRYVVILAASLLLLTGVAVASGQPVLPDWNVLDTFFHRGGNEEYAASLVNAENYSVSDDNYILSVTSSIATKRNVYFTITIVGKTEEAREFLQSDEFIHSEYDGFSSPLDPLPNDGEHIPGLVFKVSWLSHNFSGSRGYRYDSETDTALIDINVRLGLGVNHHISMRLNQMEEGLWLKFPVKPVKDVQLEIHAEGQGRGTFQHSAGGPVKLETVKISPLDVAMEYSTPLKQMGVPVLSFLWKDGTWCTWGQLHLGDSSSGSGQIFEDGQYYSYKGIWEFGGVQDISQLEAVVFEGIAYPLDRGKPYAVDVSDLPEAFSLPLGEILPACQLNSVSMFALCDALDIPYTWDEETGTAVMSYRDVTMTFSLDSRQIQLEGASVETAEMDAAPVYQDGELWADAYDVLRIHWNIELYPAYENLWENGTNPTTQEHREPVDWLILP